MFDWDTLEAKFARIGARLRVRRLGPAAAGLGDRSGSTSGTTATANTSRSPPGPSADAEVEVLDVRRADRHLLLLVREGGEKPKFLCGHDERHWFVAAVPESAPVGTVRAAKEALKPAEVRAAQARLGLGPRPATAGRTPPTAARASGSSSRPPT